MCKSCCICKASHIQNLGSNVSVCYIIARCESAVKAIVPYLAILDKYIVRNSSI